MKLGVPERGFETDRSCVDCGSDATKRRGNVLREYTHGKTWIVAEWFHCSDCLHSWETELEEGELEV